MADRADGLQSYRRIDPALLDRIAETVASANPNDARLDDASRADLNALVASLAR